MIVFDLICTNRHPFEGWFASQDEYRRQLDSEMISCPVCQDHGVEKRPSPVRFNRLTGAGASGVASAASAETPVASGSAHIPRVDLQQVLDLLLLHTEDVGTRFAEEARRMHYGESASRGIRGKAEPEELASLEDEGIEVVQIPVPSKAEWH